MTTMQNFLRAGQKQAACRCRSCLMVIKTSVRNISTAPAPRKPTLTEVVTGCYTAAFGTFAVIDAKFKDKRREDLDAQINETKAAIATLQEENVMLMMKHADKIEFDVDGELIFQRNEKWRGDEVYVPHPGSNEPAYLIWTEHGSRAFDVFKEGEYWRTIPILKRTNYKRMKRWLDEEITTTSSRVVDFSEETLQYKSNEVSNFVRAILSKIDPITSQAQSSQVRTQIEALLDQNFPKYDNIPSEEVQETHDTLCNYLVKGISADREQSIENICYNLLISPVAPIGKTMNSLLLRLSEVGYHSISEELVQNFRTHFGTYKTDYPTAICLLNHAKEANRIGLFHHYIQQIFQFEDINATKNLLVRITDEGRRLFETIIKGFAGFYKLREAAEMLCRALVIGNVINSWAIIQLFSLCIYSMDRQAAMIIIRYMANTPSLMESLLFRDISIQSIICHQLQYLLTITGISDLDNVDHAAIFKRLDVNPEGLDSFKYNLHEHGKRLKQECRIQGEERLRKAMEALGLEKGAKDTDNAIADMDLYWSAAAPCNWMTKILTPRSDQPLSYVHFTEQDYVDSWESLKKASLTILLTSQLRRSQLLIAETNNTLSEFHENFPQGLGDIAELERTAAEAQQDAEEGCRNTQDSRAAFEETQDHESTPRRTLGPFISRELPEFKPASYMEPYVPAWAKPTVPHYSSMIVRLIKQEQEQVRDYEAEYKKSLLQQKTALLESLQRNIPSQFGHIS